MTDDPAAQPDRPEDTAQRPPNPPVRYYANWFTPDLGAFDLALHFGYNRAVPPDPEWLATIVLSWEEAVIVRDILDSQIAQYKEHLGDIRTWEGTPPVIDAGSNGSPEPEPDDDDDADEDAAT